MHGSAGWSILNTHFLMITLTTNINGDYALFGLAICPGSDVKTEEGKAREKNLTVSKGRNLPHNANTYCGTGI